MTGADDGPAGGLWLADIAANLLCLVVVVLAVATRHAGPPSVALPDTDLVLPQVVATPLTAAQMVELLRLRLDHGGAPGLERIDLTAAGPRPAAVPGVAPVPGAPALVYVLAPGHHAALAAQLGTEGRAWQELDVPQALGDGAGDWAPAFAALAPQAADPARFGPALARLLAGPPPPRTLAPAAPSGPSRLAMLVQLALALAGLALTLAVWLAGRAAARRRRIAGRAPA